MDSSAPNAGHNAPRELSTAIDTRLLAGLVQQLDETLSLIIRFCRSAGTLISEETVNRMNKEMLLAKTVCEGLARDVHQIMLQEGLQVRLSPTDRRRSYRVVDVEQRSGNERRKPPMKQFIAEPRWRCGYCGERNLPAYLQRCDKCERPKEGHGRSDDSMHNET